MTSFTESATPMTDPKDTDDLPDGLPAFLATRASGPMPHPDESTDEFARRVAAARRIKRGLMAAQDKAVGIDTSHIGGGGPMPAARLAWFREQAGRALSLREADELIEALPELLDEIDRLRADQTVELDAAEREAGAGVKPWSIPSDIPARSTCAECGAMLHDVRGYSSAKGNVFSGLICLHCHPLGRLFRKGERQTLEQDVHDAVERGEVDDPPHERGPLLGEPLRPCAECGRLTQYELCSQCADPDECGHV